MSNQQPVETAEPAPSHQNDSLTAPAAPAVDPSVAAAQQAWSRVVGDGPLPKRLVLGLIAGAILAVLAAGVLIAVLSRADLDADDDEIAAAPTPLRLALTPQTAVDRSGHGTATTDQFVLAGTIAITWSTSGEEGGDCAMSLRQSDGTAGSVILNDVVSTPRNGTASMYNLPAGTYYFQVVGCGDWSFHVASRG